VVLNRSHALVRVAALLALAVSLALPRPALAADDRDAKAQARAEVAKATLHYKLGRFEEALAAYTRAYELFDAPALLFNIAQCHKNLRNHERAIFFFQGYLREETDPKRRALAEDLLAKSRAELQRQRNEPPPAPPLPLPLPATPLVEQAPKAEPPKALDPARDPVAVPAPVLLAKDLPAEPRPITRRWWFWTALGAGVLALAGGTVAYYASGQTTVVPPTGTVGTLDRR
jgi:tetratricopeptide (TPR) repeat protein